MEKQSLIDKKVCPSCKEHVQVNSHFCNSCGHKFIHEDSDTELHNQTKKHHFGFVVSKSDLIILPFVIVFLIFLSTLSYFSCKNTGSFKIPIIDKTIECQKLNKTKNSTAITQKPKIQPERKAIEAEERVHYQEQISNTQKTAAEIRKELFSINKENYLSEEYHVQVVFVPEDNSVEGLKLLDKYKKETTELLNGISFPSRLIENVAFGIVSPTFKGGDVYIGSRKFDLPEGKNVHGRTYPDGSIFVYGGSLEGWYKATLAHELGHVLSRNFTTTDWINWASLRGEKDSRGVLGNDWEYSIEEDFSEEFKKYTNNYLGNPDIWGNQTAWGESGYFYRAIGSNTEIIETPGVREFIKNKLNSYKD
jgi:hypothetical protein